MAKDKKYYLRRAANIIGITEKHLEREILRDRITAELDHVNRWRISLEEMKRYVKAYRNDEDLMNRL